MAGSYQAAIAADLRRGKRKADSNVIMNGNQQKNLKTGRDAADDPPWICESCGSEMPDQFRRCEKCHALRPDERSFRLEMRAKDGNIGRGGGFFQRSVIDDREQWDSDNEEYDEFG